MTPPPRHLSQLLARRAVSIVEFEVSNRGYWTSNRRRGYLFAERRRLGDKLAWLGGMGYTCFLELGADLLPLTGCWSDSFETRKQWSNVACAHEPAVLDVMRGHAADGAARRAAGVQTSP